MCKVKIYGLIDPRVNSIFYIGVTVGKLNDRLNGHIKNTFDGHKTGYQRKRLELMNSIQNDGFKVGIVLLREIKIKKIERVDYWEKKYFLLYTKLGYNLIQSPSKFNYSKNRKFIKRILWETNEKVQRLTGR